MNADPMIINALLKSFAVIVPEALLVLGACVLFLGGTFRAGRNLWGGISLVVLAAALASVFLVGPGVGMGRPDPKRMDRLIEQMDSDRFAEREQASHELEQIGAPALPQLRRAQEGHKSLEVRKRAGELIDRIGATVYGTTLRFDQLALFVKLVALIAGAVLVLASWKELPDSQAAECFACILVITAGLSLVGSANDLITLFLALELISIPSYVLLYLPRYDMAAQEAAMKYFLLSVFSSALLLFGFSYLYGLTGTTNLPAEAEALAQGGTVLPPVALVALVMVVAGLGFKITAVPFHFYAPDVYQGTASSNAALLAMMPKAAGFIALLRVLAFVPPETLGPEGLAPLGGAVPRPGLILGTDTITLFWIMAAVTMTLGNLLALLQTNVKRLLAYSSVAHAGYMLIGLAVASAAGAGRATQDVSGVEAVLFYLVAYGSMTVGAFGVLIYLSTPQRPVETVDDLAGLSRSHPGVALLMMLFLFSLIGIPLTAGFAGKLFLFLGAMNLPGQGDAAMALQARLFRILALIGAVNAAIGAWYYLRLVGVMYLRSALRPLENRRAVPGLVALTACALLTLAFGVYPRPLLRAVEIATSRPPAPVAGQMTGPAVGQR